MRFIEGGLAFEADVRAGQKTGHFLDQRANRLRVGSMASDRDVLDVFASTGGFSVHAAAGGARSVHAVDLSAPTLAAAERNMALNEHLDAVRNCVFTTEVGDAFEVMVQLARAGRDYDIVVVDPPSFAQRQANVDGALRAYTRLTHLALRLVRPGGVLVQASCSSRVTADQFFDTVLDAAAAAGRPMTEIARTGHDVDHPVGFREGEYLKAGFWRVGAGRAITLKRRGGDRPGVALRTRPSTRGGLDRRAGALGDGGSLGGAPGGDRVGSIRRRPRDTPGTDRDREVVEAVVEAPTPRPGGGRE